MSTKGEMDFLKAVYVEFAKKPTSSDFGKASVEELTDALVERQTDIEMRCAQQALRRKQREDKLRQAEEEQASCSTRVEDDPVLRSAAIFLSRKIDAKKGNRWCIQKMLFYADALCLVHSKKPMFKSQPAAWDDGPVYTLARNILNDESEGNLDLTGDPLQPLSSDTEKLLDAVFCELRDKSKDELVALTHREAPWRLTDKNMTITHKKMADWFALPVGQSSALKNLLERL